MSVPPTLIRGATGADGHPLARSAVGWWSPAALGIDGIVLGVSATTQTPVLMVAGLNSFMLYVSTVPANATTQVDMEIRLSSPLDETSIITGNQYWTESVPTNIPRMFGFGAFNSGFALGFMPSPSYVVWWLLTLVFTNSSPDPPIGDAFALTAHLFAGRR